MKLYMYFYALLIGIINSAVGSGGGIVSVFAMKKSGLEQKNAQATTLALILPLAVVSAVLYAINDIYSPADTLKYIPFGVAGSVLGVRITEKIKNKTLKKFFAVFMLWSGLQMILR